MADYLVLVIDDNKVIANSLSKFIENEVEGFTVAEHFSDGSEAIDYIDKNHVDVIITDVKMHNVSGIDVAKYVCEKDLGIEVIIVSAYKDFEYAREAMDYGVRKYLVKPVLPEELENVLKKIKNILDVKKDVQVKDAQSTEITAEQNSMKDEVVIQKAIDYINKNYMHPISLADVAKKVYLSEFYFSKLFKKQIDKSFTEYLVQVRMEKALELLKTKKYKIYEISGMVGYESNYFVKVFKNYTGFTPREYVCYLEESDE